MEIMALKKNKTDKSFCGKSQITLDKTNTDLRILQIQVNTIEDPMVNEFLAYQIKHLENTLLSIQASMTATPTIKAVKYKKSIPFKNKKGDNIKYQIRSLKLYLRNYLNQTNKNYIKITYQFLQENAKYIGKAVLLDLD